MMERMEFIEKRLERLHLDLSLENDSIQSQILGRQIVEYTEELAFYHKKVGL